MPIVLLVGRPRRRAKIKKERNKEMFFKNDNLKRIWSSRSVQRKKRKVVHQSARCRKYTDYRRNIIKTFQQKTI